MSMSTFAMRFRAAIPTSLSAVRLPRSPSTTHRSISTTRLQSRSYSGHSYNAHLPRPNTVGVSRIIALTVAGVTVASGVIAVPILYTDGAVMTFDEPRTNHNVSASLIHDIEVRQQSTVPVVGTLFSTLSFVVRLMFRLPYLLTLWTPLFTSYLVLPTATWYAYLKLTLEWSGPVFVKFGQWASTRPDVFSKEMCETLSTLQSAVHAHSFKYTKRMMRQCFGPHYTESLTVSPELIGSGSMAQVHHGVYDDGHTKVAVAVKILHPSTKPLIHTDLFLMHVGATLLTSLPNNKWLSLTESVEQFRILITQHANLRSEADNLETFRRHFSEWDNIHFPAPIWPFVTSDIIVETYERGVPLHAFMERDSHPQTVVNPTSALSKVHLPFGLSVDHMSDHNRMLARLGMKMFLKMMIDDNFIHADLHPGNLLVTLKPSVAEQERAKGNFRAATDPQLEDLVGHPSTALSLTVLDAALVTALTPANRANFLSLFGALVEGDGVLAARLMRENAKEEAVTDVPAYEREMSALVSQIPQLDLNHADIGLLLNQCLDIVRRHHVKIESDFASLVMSLIVVEGVGRRLDPTMSVIKEAIPILLRNETARKILWEKCGFGLINSMTLKAALS